MSKEALKKEIKQLCQSIIDSDLDQQASLMIHKMGKVYNHLLVYNYLNQQEQISETVEANQNAETEEVIESASEVSRKTESSNPVTITENTELTSEAEAITEEEETVEETLTNEPIEDQPAATVYERLAIKQQLSIGLNDKFAFIRDLFDGNADDFRKVMEEINKFNNAEEAKSYFSLQVASQHSWGEDKEETVQRFLDIIERRV